MKRKNNSLYPKRVLLNVAPLLAHAAKAYAKKKQADGIAPFDPGKVPIKHAGTAVSRIVGATVLAEPAGYPESVAREIIRKFLPKIPGTEDQLRDYCEGELSAFLLRHFAGEIRDMTIRCYYWPGGRQVRVAVATCDARVYFFCGWKDYTIWHPVADEPRASMLDFERVDVAGVLYQADHSQAAREFVEDLPAFIHRALQKKAASQNA